MRAIIFLLALLSPRLLAQGPAPRFMYVYRDSLKHGADSAYRVIENEGAQICADLRCPNPYIGIESLSGPREAWWSVAGARFIVVTIARDHRRVDGSAWAMADSTLYAFEPAGTRHEADSLARHANARVFAVRPNWSMPAPEWLTADPDFWRSAPARRTR